jgi:hypothetical protein
MVAATMSGTQAPPPFPSSGGTPVPGAIASSAAPPPFPTQAQSAGPAPPPFPSVGGKPVLEEAPAAPTPAPNAPSQHGGILRNIAAGALELPQDIANAGKYMWQNAGAAGAGVAMGTDPAINLPASSVQSKYTGPAQVPGVTKYIQGTSDTSLPERMARGVGEMVPFAVAPEAEGAGFLARGAGALGLGASSGAGGYVGQTLAPYVGLSPQAGDFWGSLIGGAGGSLSGVAASKIGLGGEGLAEIAPVTKGLQQQYAANKIRQFGGSDIEAQTQAARNVQPVIPGSNPTAAQAGQNPQLARLEAALEQSGRGAPLQEAQVAQANARAAHIQGAQFTPEQQAAARLTGKAPIAGTPSNLSDYLTQARAQDEVNANSPVNIAEQARMSGLNEPMIKTAGAKQPGLASVSGVPEQYQVGAALRTPLTAGDQIRQQATSRLYNTLDERNPALNLEPMADAAAAARQHIADSGLENISPVESRMYDRAQEYGEAGAVPWKQINGFRSELNDAISDTIDPKTGRNTPATGRLMALKRATDNSISTAIDREATANPEAYTSTLQDQARLWQQAKTADERQTILQSSGGPQLRSTGDTGTYQEPVGASGIGPAPRAMGQEPGGLPNAPGAGRMAQRGAESGVNPAWSQQDIDTYRAALQSHAQRMGLYWNKYIGKMIAPDQGGDFRMPDEQVVNAALPGGDKSRQVATLIKNIGAEQPGVLDAYGQAIALSLRKAAVKDGVNVDPNALARWQQNHAGMLSVFPEVAQKVRTIAGAQDMVEKAMAARNTAMDQYNHKAIQGLLNGDDPEVAMQTVLNGSPTSARQFMNSIQKSPQAVAGAKAAAANNIINRLIKTTSGENQDARIGALEGMLRQPTARQNMRTVFGPQFEGALRDVVRDEKATNTRALMRKTGDSPTAFYREAINQLNEPTTWLGKIVRNLNPLEAMVAVGDSHGLVGRAAAGLLDGYLRSFSSNKVDAAQRLLAHILTSPEATAQALKRYSATPSATRQFTRSMAKTFATAQANQGTQ